MARLLVVGAVNTDLVATVRRAPDAGETVVGGSFGEYGGGKGANQAVAAARSGTDVTLLSAVGADAYGERRRRDLEADGIDVSAIHTFDDAASGIAVIVVESSGENRICDLPGARMMLTPEGVVAGLDAANPDALLATNELPHRCLLALFRAAHDRGVPVWFNAAPFSKSATDLLPHVDTLIVNQIEAEGFSNSHDGRLGSSDLVARIRALPVRQVVVTLGGDGARLVTADQDVVIPSISVDVVDTTGAGDTFCGAWAAATLRGDESSEALAYANAAAALSVTKAGAQSSIPNREQVSGFRKQQRPGV